jgi:2-iminobutanoate/2-iminopropanoate deaminase
MATVRFSNPDTVHKPARYSHSVLITGETKRLVLSGQVGVELDGSVGDTGAAQVAQAFLNLGAVLAAHSMTPANVVKVTMFITDRALLESLRTQRAAFFGTHVPTSTLLIVAGLADPRYMVEIEAEAVA